MLIVDRLEEKSIVCVDDAGISVTIESAALLQPVKEGDILYEAEGGYAVDKAATAARRKKMRERLDRLFDR